MTLDTLASQAFTTWLAVSAGNFIFQMFFKAEPEYGLALDRSMFQGVALACLYWAMRSSNA